ncbi:dihydroflavonol-4-reductase [Fusarium heterosporum]|uniref:Dihydroflavonol-4-reductase n=1 Tax=Fusarium heterosporum TaxID=42747 RepID=A0A8H5TCR1_FUSHE|nr:dihydroflavonol-4-reductase [Fusarium heterosporum]
MSSKGVVLVTGANGFIGARTVDAFLSANYSVRAAVRSQSSASSLLSALPSYASSGRLTTILVPDIMADGAFNDAVKGVVAVAHLAAPVDFSNTDIDYVIGSSLQGTLGILKSAIKEPGLKSFVYMSSIVTVRGSEPKDPSRGYSEEDWNDQIEDALTKAGKEATGHQIYIASKTKAERAFWEFKEKNAGHINFTMTAVNPVWVAGPPLILPDDPEKLSETAVVAYRIMNGQDMPAVGPGNGTHVDVRDVARLVVFAVEHNQVADGQRYIAGGSGNSANIQAYRDVLRKAYPDRQGIIGKGEPGKGYMRDYSTPEGGFKVSGSKAVEATGQGWIPFDQMVLDSAKAYEKYF